MAADRSDLPTDNRIDDRTDDRTESRTANRKPKRAIVLSGGGARGAYEAGVLRFILDELPKRTGVRPDFDIICGTSVGAIHACFLAATADETETRGERLTTIWQNLKVHEVFRFTARDFLRLPKRMLGVKRVAQLLRDGQRPDRLYGLLNTEPLERLVLQSIPWRGIRRNVRSGQVVLVKRRITNNDIILFFELNFANIPFNYIEPVMPGRTDKIPRCLLSRIMI